MSKRQNSGKEAPSRVLLVCVYDTIVLNITNEIVYARFSEYGNILKILIFEKGQVTKFFLEFTNIDSAEQAKLNLDGAKLFENICKMNIYYSNFSKVDLKHQTTEGINLEPYIMPQVDPYGYPATSYQYNNPSFQVYPMNPYAAYFQPFPEVPQALYQADVEEMAQAVPPPQQPQQPQALNTPNSKSIQLEMTIQNDIDSLLKSEEKAQVKVEVKPNALTYSISQNYQFLTFPIKYNVTNKQLYNLFSNFGNVSYIKQTNQHAYIKFRSYEFASIAKKYLSGYMLLGNILDLNFIMDTNNALPSEEQFSNITYFDSSFDRYFPSNARFNNGKSISINSPSNTIHISSIRRQVCREGVLRELFEEFGCIVGVELLSTGSEKNMALIQFMNIEDSFYALSQMHGSTLAGRKLQISFTKSRIC